MMKVLNYKIPHNVLFIVALVLLTSCQGQQKMAKTTHTTNFNLKGKVKFLSEDLCGAKVRADGSVFILDFCVTPNDLTYPFKMEFNPQGYLTLHKYFANNKFWRDYYEYENDSILIGKKAKTKYIKNKKKLSSFLEESDYGWWTENYSKYNEEGEVVFLADNYFFEDEYPLEEYFFEYDKHGNVNKSKLKSYYYKLSDNKEKVTATDSIVFENFKYKNEYEDTLLLSSQFMKWNDEILTLNDKGEVNDKHYGKFWDCLNPDAVRVTIGEKTVYTYDNLGHRTAITTISAYGKSSTNNYTYYSNGDLKSSTYRNIDGSVLAIEKFNEEGYRTYYRNPYNQYYDFKYTERDKEGNWVTCQVNKNGKIYYFITREIAYY